MKHCGISECDRRHYAFGLCQLHYKRKRRGSAIDAPVMRSGALEERFWARVTKTENCWEWSASCTAQGYGQIRYEGASHLAHRLSYVMHYGEIGASLQVDHICRNRKCVRPDHLRLATDGLNKQNCSPRRSNNKSGARGVSWDNSRGKWVARATVKGVVHQAGYFESFDDANSAIRSWRQEHMPYSAMDQDTEILI